MEKDYSKNGIWLTASIILILLIVSLVPEGNYGKWTYKKSDILSELFKKKQTTFTRNIAKVKLKKPKVVNFLKRKQLTPPTDLIEIEDYSPTGCHLEPFYRKLAQRDSLSRPIHIAYYGDSFIEGEIITADVREALQTQYGGEGAGFVPLVDNSIAENPNVVINRVGLQTYSIVFNRNKNQFEGLEGRCHFAQDGSSLKLKCTSYKPHVKSASRAQLYFMPLKQVDIEYTKNEDVFKQVHYEKSNKVQSLIIQGQKISSLDFKFSKTDSLVLFGVGLDGQTGISVDNLSLRGNSGLSLRNIPSRRLKEFNELRPYDLIILQYGLNAFGPDSSNYNYYKKGMINVIENLKQCFPEACFILYSVGDKGELMQGEIVTHHLLSKFINMQREIARQTGICFWNMFDAMGGEGTIANWAQMERPIAAKDFTHISHAGGRIIAKSFIKSFQFEQKKYVR